MTVELVKMFLPCLIGQLKSKKRMRDAHWLIV